MFKKSNSLLFLMLVLSISLLTACSSAQVESEPSPVIETPEIILATTTSTQDSGLLDVLLPVFEESGYIVQTIAVGTGAALEMGQQGNADVLLTHAPASEQPLVDEETVIDYTLLMHNDFIVVGPSDDPAGIMDAATAAEAFTRISEGNALFISRGDNSGTNKKELQLWASANITPSGDTYQETGSGMGDTLNIAAEKGGYTLTDRATYLNLKENLGGLDILFEGDENLNNIYHVMAVNPEKFDKANYEGATAFIQFLISDAAQEIIKDYGTEKFGQPLFFSDVK